MSEYNIDNGKTAITVSHGSAYTVCKGDAASQWEMAILGC